MKILCPNCGTEIRDGKTFCTKCGTKVDIEGIKSAAKAKQIKIISIAAAALLVVIAGIVLAPIINKYVIVPNKKYKDAIALKNSKDFDKAIEAFEELGDFKDSAEQINLCYTGIKDEAYSKAVGLLESGNYADAVSAFSELEGYKDSAKKIEECNEKANEQIYSEAVEAVKNGNYSDAKTLFLSIADYKDSSDYAMQLSFATTPAGATLYFGHYDTDGAPDGKKESILWEVLEKKDGKVLIIAKNPIDCKPFNTEKENVTWENCSLRKWLNEDFYNTAFSDDEKNMIELSHLTTEKNKKANTSGGNDTDDRLFLLSIEETLKYFPLESLRMCTATAFAYNNGAYRNPDNQNCFWWLRSAGSKSCAAGITSTGTFNYYGPDVNNTEDAVRPALWVNISIADFKNEVVSSDITTVEDNMITYSKGLKFEKYLNGYELVSLGSCKDDTIMIPPTYNNLPVLSIGEDVFDFTIAGYNGKSTIKKVVVPEGVQEFNSTVYHCTIKELQLPSTITHINPDMEIVAMTCYSLINKITVDSNNNYYKVVNRCLIETNTKTVIHIEKGSKIPTDKSVSKVNAVFTCDNITELKIPEGVTDVDLSGDGEITLYLPKTLKMLKMETLDGDFGLPSITIVYNGTVSNWQNGVSTVGYDGYCYDLTEIGVCKVVCTDGSLIYYDDDDWDY